MFSVDCYTSASHLWGHLFCSSGFGPWNCLSQCLVCWLLYFVRRLEPYLRTFIILLTRFIIHPAHATNDLTTRTRFLLAKSPLNPTAPGVSWLALFYLSLVDLVTPDTSNIECSKEVYLDSVWVTPDLCTNTMNCVTISTTCLEDEDREVSQTIDPFRLPSVSLIEKRVNSFFWHSARLF